MNKKFVDLIKNVEVQIDAGMREDLKEFLEDDRFLFSHINVKEKNIS